MFTGWKPAPRTRSSAASRSATLKVMWCGPAPCRATNRARKSLRSTAHGSSSSTGMPSPSCGADPDLHRPEADRLAAEDHGAAERAGEEAQRVGGVGGGERDVVEVVCGGHGGGRLCCAERRREPKGSGRGIRVVQQRVRAPAVPGRRASADHGRGRDRAGRRPRRLQVHVGDRAPLPHRVLAPLRQRGVPRLSRGRDLAHPPRLGHLQHHAAGQPSGARRRARRDARSPVGGALRVRHGPRLVDHRAARLRHHRSRPHARHVRRGRARVPQDVAAPRSTRASTASSSRCRRATCSRSRTPRRTRRCGSRPATRRRSRRPRAWGSACCASRWAGPSRSSRSSSSTRRRSRTRSRSASS